MLRCYDSRLAYWMQGACRWVCEGVDVQMGMVHLTMVAVSELGGELRASEMNESAHWCDEATHAPLEAGTRSLAVMALVVLLLRRQ